MHATGKNQGNIVTKHQSKIEEMYGSILREKKFNSSISIFTKHRLVG